jgi:hypothetical protein
MILGSPLVRLGARLPRGGCARITLRDAADITALPKRNPHCVVGTSKQ